MATGEYSPNWLLYGSISLSLATHFLLIGALLILIGGFPSENKDLSCLKVTLIELPKPDKEICPDPSAPPKSPGSVKSLNMENLIPRGQELSHSMKKKTDGYTPSQRREKIEPSGARRNSVPHSLSALSSQPQKEVPIDIETSAPPLAIGHGAEPTAQKEIPIEIETFGSGGSLQEEGDPIVPGNDGAADGFGTAEGVDSGGNGNGQGAENAKNDYLAMVRLRIDRHKTYPQAARMRQLQGTVVVHFVITLEGTVKTLKIIQSSGYTVLDEAGLKAIRDASPFPRPPDKLVKGEIPVEIPIVFELT